ncbi:MAG: DMT family transporter [Pseudomonadota bacterium]|nr:DMT family transporter [Pseudomonadota bacterium]
MKLGIATFPPLSFRAAGMWIGLALLWLFLRLRKTPLTVPRTAWPELGKLAITNVVIWHVLAIVSLQQLSSGRAAILGYTMPIFSALLGYAVFGERLAPRQLAGVGAAAVGVALLVWHELGAAFGHPLAAFGMLFAAATWALGTQLLRRTRLTLPILALIFWMTAITTLVMTLLAIAFESPRWHVPDEAALFGIVYNAVLIIAFAQPVWLWLARTLPPIASTLSVMMIPVLGTLSGAWALHEQLYWQDAAAMLLMLVAIASVLAPKR